MSNLRICGKFVNLYLQGRPDEGNTNAHALAHALAHAHAHAHAVPTLMS